MTPNTCNRVRGASTTLARRRALVLSLTAVLAGTYHSAVIAQRSAGTFEFAPPMVDGNVQAGSEIAWFMDANFSEPPVPLVPMPVNISVQVTSPEDPDDKAAATGRVSKAVFRAFAYTRGSNSSSRGRAVKELIARDPTGLHARLVKLVLKYSAATEVKLVLARPGEPQRFSRGQFVIVIGTEAEAPGPSVTFSKGQVVRLTTPGIDSRTWMQVVGNAGFGAGDTGWATQANVQVEDVGVRRTKKEKKGGIQGIDISDKGEVVFWAFTDSTVFAAIEAFASGEAVTFVDPVIEPHPDNPDIIIEFPRASDDPTPGSPFGELTLEELEAQGFNMTAFREAGFFDPPVSPQPTPPPVACPTVLPAPGWLCANGGWVPPDHPLAHSPTAPPTACSTVQPAPGWICANGGWLPPDHPHAGGGTTAPAPPFPPPSGCTTMQPDPSWVCVNGGWLPPNHPLAGRGGG